VRYGTDVWIYVNRERLRRGRHVGEVLELSEDAGIDALVERNGTGISPSAAMVIVYAAKENLPGTSASAMKMKCRDMSSCGEPGACWDSLVSQLNLTKQQNCRVWEDGYM
jgi:hypothetical protein